MKNVLLSAGYSRQITLNFAKFNDLIQLYTPNPHHHSMLVDEIQYIILGKQWPGARKEFKDPKLILQHLSKSLGVLMNKADKWHKLR